MAAPIGLLVQGEEGYDASKAAPSLPCCPAGTGIQPMPRGEASSSRSVAAVGEVPAASAVPSTSALRLAP